MSQPEDGATFDATSDPHTPRDPAAASAGGRSGRRYVGVQFECCGIYARIYINQNLTAYEGNCPRCAKRVRMKIGPGGTDARFFSAR